MWVFLTRRLRRWLFFALGAPVLSWVLGKATSSRPATDRQGRAGRCSRDATGCGAGLAVPWLAGARTVDMTGDPLGGALAIAHWQFG